MVEDTRCVQSYGWCCDANKAVQVRSWSLLPTYSPATYSATTLVQD